MTVDEATLQAMTDAIVEAVQPEEVVLFGSQARGSSRRDSDVDPLVVVPDSEETRRHRRRLTVNIYRRLLEYPVAKDILLCTRSEVERWRHVEGHIVATSLQEGRRLYARS